MGGGATFLARYAKAMQRDIDLTIGGRVEAYRPSSERFTVLCHGGASALSALVALREAGSPIPAESINDAVDILIAKATWREGAATLASDHAGREGFPGVLTGYGGVISVLEQVVGSSGEPLGIGHFASVAASSVDLAEHAAIAQS